MTPAEDANLNKDFYGRIHNFVYACFVIEIYPRGVYNVIARKNFQKVVCRMNNKHTCCSKKTMRDDDERKKLLNRLNRIEGQVRGIKAMLENDAYCTDILMQSAAVNAAVNAFNRELITSHIKGCVVRDIRAGNEEVIDELTVTLQKLMK